MIRRGDVYWVDLGRPSGSGPGFRHPHVVVQNDLFNRSAMATVIVCALTSNLECAASPGNVPLGKGEANLPRRSVVNVSQVFTVDKAALVKRIGNVPPDRLRQILDGIRLLTEPRDVE